MDFVAEQSVASLTKKEQPLRDALLRKVRDSNPRYPKGVYRISSPARSITLPTFLIVRGVSTSFLEIGCKFTTNSANCQIYWKINAVKVIC